MNIVHLSEDTAVSEMERWQVDQPPRFNAAFSTVAQSDDSVHLGIFSDSHLQSVVTLQPRGPGIYEVHLAMRKGAAVTELLPAFLSIRTQLFGQLGVREISGWVPTLHWGVRKVAEQVGFTESGATLLQMIGSRLTEWKQLILKVN